MRPRTLVIVAGLMLVGALALRFLVIQFGWLPVSEEVVLKKAIALKVTYVDPSAGPNANLNMKNGGVANVVQQNGIPVPIGVPKVKSIWIEDPAEVIEALASLRLKENGDDRGFGPRFFPGGRRPPPNPENPA